MTSANATTTNTTGAARGFSLVEILIAILVLALGLLGLGAVFPVVISQQRDAVDTTQGTIVVQTVEGLLTSGEFANWQAVLETEKFSRQKNRKLPTYLWDVGVFNGGARWGGALPPYSSQGSGSSIQYSATTGVLQLAGSPVPASARVWPAPFGATQPRYVWDLVARRAPVTAINIATATEKDHGQLEVAVFVRRIDPRIKVPTGKTLSDVLTGAGGIKPDQFRLPVSSRPDETNANKVGEPTLDGNGELYGVPILMTVEVREGSGSDRWAGRDRMRFVLGDQMTGVTTQTQRDMAARVGQQLVDNTGVVRTVLERIITRNPDEVVVRVSPPFTSGEFTKDSDNDRDLAPRAARVRQVAFVPNIPVAVRVFRIRSQSNEP